MQRRDEIQYFDINSEKLHEGIQTIIFKPKVIVIFILNKKIILRNLAFTVLQKAK